MGLVWHAASLCPEGMLRAIGLVTLGLLATLAAARFRGPKILKIVGTSALWGVLLWLLRDTEHLLGDSRVWIKNAETLGRNLPAYRAPGAAFVLGSFVDLFRGLVSSEHVLAAATIASGLAVFGIFRSWALAHSESRARWCAPALAALLAFAQPLSFVFYGHIESYALFAVPFTLFLVFWAEDVAQDRLRLRTLTALTVATILHLAGGLAGVPFVTWLFARHRERRRTGWVVFLLLMTVPALVLLVVPGLRQYTFLAREWTPSSVMDYVWDVLNMWLAVLIPGLFLLVRRHSRRLDSVEEALSRVFLAFMLFPVVAYFALGGLRDLDIMSPASLALSGWVLRGVMKSGRWRRTDAAIGAVGLILAAALISTTRCPAGPLEVERHFSRGAMLPEGRANTAEVLSFYYRERHDLARARRFIEGALETTPGNHRLYGPLGEIQAAQGDTAAAIRSLTLALGSLREDRTAAYLARLMTATNRAREAVNMLLARGDLVITHGDINAALAVAYVRLGAPDSALVFIDERLKYAPDDAVAYFNAGSALSHLGMTDAALEALNQAVSLDPENDAYRAARDRIAGALGAEP